MTNLKQQQLLMVLVSLHNHIQNTSKKDCLKPTTLFCTFGTRNLYAMSPQNEALNIFKNFFMCMVIKK